jgi:hypothetical protein
MRRLLLTAALLLPLPPLAFGQRDPEPKNGHVTIPITLHPAAPPVPLFTHHLYPEYGDLQPGNRVQGLLKVFMEQDNFFRVVGNEEWQKDFDCPLSEFSGKHGIRSGIAYPEKYTRMGGYLDKGARYKSIDWNEYFDLRKDGFYLLLPEVQKMRQLATVLRMRMRAETKGREFDKAVVTIQSTFGLAQALEQHPCLIGSLVALAIVEQARAGLEELVQQPGCPNLYWSLTDLPTPLISLRTAVGGERLFLISSYEKYLLTDRALSEREIDEFLGEMNELLKLEDQRGGLDSVIKNAKVRFALVAADGKRIDGVRKRLIAKGAKPDVVKSMPEMQLAFLDEFDRYEVLRDEFFKAYNRPYYEAAPWIAKTEAELKKAKEKGDIIGPALLPAVWKCKQAQARADQRFAMLRITEAIRLYAHGHKGELPATLADCGVPVPNDPFTGQPFTYVVNDGVATLHGGDPKQGEQAYRWYELRVAK